MQQTFEVQAGNGRLYKLTPEKKQIARKGSSMGHR